MYGGIRSNQNVISRLWVPYEKTDSVMKNKLKSTVSYVPSKYTLIVRTIPKSIDNFIITHSLLYNGCRYKGQGLAQY